jgi:uncharacterized membrane protein YdjX (TVP38/TMEM64 family)
MATVAVVPGVVFSLAGGALFGPLWGGLWNLIDATLGATLSDHALHRGRLGRAKGCGLLNRLIDGVDAEG